MLALIGLVDQGLIGADFALRVHSLRRGSQELQDDTLLVCPNERGLADPRDAWPARPSSRGNHILDSRGSLSAELRSAVRLPREYNCLHEPGDSLDSIREDVEGKIDDIELEMESIKEQFRELKKRAPKGVPKKNATNQEQTVKETATDKDA